MDHLNIDAPRVVAHSHSIEQQARRVEQAGRDLAGRPPIDFGSSGPALSEVLERCSAAFVARAAQTGEAGRAVRAFAERVVRQDEEAIAP